MSVVAIHNVESPASPLFRQSQSLYRRVFPRDEQMPKRYFYEHLMESSLGLSRPFNFHYLVATLDGEVAGFGCCTYMAVLNMGFIDYLAVDGSASGRGVGSKIRRTMVERMERDAEAAGYHSLSAVLGEVNPESPWLRHLIARNEVFALDIDYQQPPLEPGKKAVSLVLYVEPIERDFETLPVAEVETLLYSLYHRLYRIPYPLSTPSFRYMLKQLRGRSRVGHRRAG